VTQVAKSAVGKGIESALEFGAKRDRESPAVTQTGPRPQGGLPAGMNTPPGSGWGPIVQALRNAGTPHRITSTNTGKHATNSLHYKNRAVDLGGPRPGDGPGMRRIFETIRGAFGGKITELFYTPMGYSIKNGAVTAPIAAAGHRDHVHAGLADGGQVNPRTGGTLLRLAEAGLPETVVDTGKMNSLIDGILSGKVRGGDGVRIEEGAIHVTIVRPPDEPSERSLNSGLRSLASFGLFGSS
jgi:hypothetical protein